MTDYRYTLARNVCGIFATYDLGRLCWVMLNPSTADDTVDDPTIRRVIRFTRDAGYRELEVVNLFAARTTRPVHLTEMTDPVGPGNASAILNAFRRADAVVFAWGAWWMQQHVTRRPARINVERLAMDRYGHTPRCLGVTTDGSPRHPLYVKADQPLIEYEPPRFQGTP